MTKRHWPIALCASFVLTSLASAGDTGAALNATQFEKNTSPCQNLFDFVNANWLKAHPIPADRTTWGASGLLDEGSLNAQHGIVETLQKASNSPGTIEQKIGDFYASGMNEAAIEKSGFDPIKDDLKRIDGLSTPEDFINFIRDYAAQGMPFLFGFSTQADFHDSRTMIGYARQGGLGLPERDYYFKTDANSKTIREAYVAYVATSLQLVGVKKDAATKQAASVMELETKLAEASLPIVELRNPENQYHYLAMPDADKTTPHFSWEKFFASQNVIGAKGFSLSQPKFFAAMDKLLVDTPPETWRAYLRFHLVNAAQPYLSKKFVDADFEFYSKTLRGQREQKPRWKRVLGTINRNMGMALGQIYVKENFPPEAKARAQELVDNLRTSLKARIQNLEWMSDTTKQKAIEKWNTFLPKIGYPDQWRDWNGLTVTRASYFGNVRIAQKFDHDWRMAKIGKPVDRNEWNMTPQTVNAYYNPLQNEIVFPAAILQPPFFDVHADDALNYGGIGAVIGHEMTHGYDDRGSQFDAQGNYNNWWTPDDRKKFEARTDKLVAQFDGYVAIDDLHVKGKQTLGENIADLAGLNVSYDALQTALASHPDEAKAKIDGYTEDQRFFLNFARSWAESFKPEELKLRVNTDVHAPAPLRAIASPSNMPAFAQAFSCKAGDAMVRAPDVQVKIW
ncbi:MAG: M13 family metallopeptidase [Rudaea sp.]